MATQTARTEFAQALKAVSTQTGLDANVIIDKVKEALVAAYKKDARDNGIEVDTLEYEVQVHQVTGEMRIFSFDPEKPEEKEDVTPPGFGRIAAQTAKQVIHQKLREAERGAIMEEFEVKKGSLVSGMVLRFDGGNVRVEIGKAEGLMPYEERIPDERLNLNQRVTFLFKEVRETPRGEEIILSRNSEDFVKKLFEREVPEIGGGNVEIKAISREAGVRTKIAVSSNQPGIDPVGSCVGQKGVRVQAVTNELGGERVDIIAYTEDEKEFVKSSLSPVEVVAIKLDKKNKKAIVKVAPQELSIAIGSNGQNVRLASKLTGYDIDIESSEPKESKKSEEMIENTEPVVEEVKDEVIVETQEVQESQEK